ncbi:hypothetical protein [Clostridium sporogenes]|uniref:Uncharacterized protein n=1 Tax=Clostridium sporogenes TaxID=1509 RepID=A0AAE6I9K7_CLOSG|nr:hypothetical protein [Clostridium sporogenes]QDY34582.1 hypothetical protein CGS26_19990 [Clostridium sporogenes]
MDNNLLEEENTMGVGCENCKCNSCLRAIIHEGSPNDCHLCNVCSDECDNSKYSSKCERYIEY